MYSHEDFELSFNVVDCAMDSNRRDLANLLFSTSMTPVSFPSIHLNDTGVKLLDPDTENETHPVALIARSPQKILKLLNQIRVLFRDVPGLAHVRLKVIDLNW